ncbi:MAG TPA: hypothetical protein PL110_17525 [Candidatus Eremiobacteraeota bacterium]|nr:MAG: hypothetical protein BWY64_01707 [bacterium ADurb.Bin363]HPZ09896.1 hypothetical protein [Candidatus Eremiobacteraeota bacterium]
MDNLPRHIMVKLEHIQEADIVIGIGSLNKNTSLKDVIKALSLGLAKYFPDYKAVLINATFNSLKSENQIFLTLDPYEDRELNFIYTSFMPVHRILIEEELNRKKFLRAVFQTADILNCDACAIVGGDLECINPEWVEALLTPVIKVNYDYISPVYITHRYDALIVNHLVYPITRSLYGVELRYPAGGDYGFSIDLVRTFLEKDIWNTDIDIDIWMYTCAIGEGFELGQTFLGSKYIDEYCNISEMAETFRKNLASIFRLMKIYRDIWSNCEEEKHIASFGYNYKIIPKTIYLNLEEIKSEGNKKIEKFKSIIRRILSENTFSHVEQVLSQKEIIFFPADLWIKIIYEYSSYMLFHPDDYNLLESIIPLFLFYIFSSVSIEVDENFEENIQYKCLKFMEMRTYLLQLWNNT